MKVYYLDYPRMLKKAAWLLALLVALLLIYRFVQYNIFSPATTKYEPIYQGDQGSKKIALTCNVVWGEEFIPDMLKVLKENKINITFYMGGQWVEQFPELSKKIADGGHELGNHGYSHPHPTYLSKKQNMEEIKKTEQAVYSATGKKTNLFAPPYGEFNHIVLEAAGQMGYKTILWSIDTIDWQRPSPQVIIDRVMRKHHNGAIVLMHPTAPTVQALPKLIEGLKEEGYQFVTVSEIIGVNRNSEEA